MITALPQFDDTNSPRIPNINAAPRSGQRPISTRFFTDLNKTLRNATTTVRPARPYYTQICSPMAEIASVRIVLSDPM